MFLFSETSFELLVEEGSALLPIEISGIGAVSTSRPSYKDMAAMMDFLINAQLMEEAARQCSLVPDPTLEGGVWDNIDYRSSSVHFKYR